VHWPWSKWTIASLRGRPPISPHIRSRRSTAAFGKIDEASYDVGAGYIVLDTSPWSLWKKVMLPAGVIMRVDSEEENVFVNLTRTLPSSTWTRTATTRTCA
jgi:hypothetical protein